jgi:hypothetical protein
VIPANVHARQNSALEFSFDKSVSSSIDARYRSHWATAAVIIFRTGDATSSMRKPRFDAAFSSACSIASRSETSLARTASKPFHNAGLVLSVHVPGSTIDIAIADSAFSDEVKKMKFRWQPVGSFPIPNKPNVHSGIPVKCPACIGTGDRYPLWNTQVIQKTDGKWFLRDAWGVEKVC